MTKILWTLCLLPTALALGAAPWETKGTLVCGSLARLTTSGWVVTKDQSHPPYRRTDTPLDTFRRQIASQTGGDQNVLTQALDPLNMSRWRVLDTGTGDGDVVRKLRASGVEIEGLDLLLDQKQKSEHFFFEADVRSTGLPDGIYDLVLSAYNVFHYPERPEFYEAALKELARILKPGGRLAVMAAKGAGLEALLATPHFKILFPDPRSITSDSSTNVHLLLEKR